MTHWFVICETYGFVSKTHLNYNVEHLSFFCIREMLIILVLIPINIIHEKYNASNTIH